MVSKMTDNEIKKALEYCSQQGSMSECERCKIKRGCRFELIKLALDLINRQDEKINRLQAENEKLNEELKNSRTENKELKNLRADLTSLQAENERLTHITRNLIGEIKAEAYTECFDFLRKHACSYDLDNYHSFDAVDVDYFDDFFKEMVGEDNEK